MITIVIEDDRVLRLFEMLAGPQPAPERAAAFADYYAHDDIDLGQWRDTVRGKMPGLFPCRLEFASTQEELRERLQSADAAVVEGLEVRERELNAARTLATVVKFGTMTGNIAVEACRRRGIEVRIVRRRTNIAVAEHALALMLGLAKRWPQSGGCVSAERIGRSGPPYRSYDTRHVGGNNYARIGGLRNLAGMTLGIVGMGETGREVAARARAFGMCLLYHQRQPLPAGDEGACGAEYRTLDALLSEADVVSLHLPLTPQTRGLIDRAALARMKPGALLVNTARAELVERQALMEALATGRLGGAALDVHYEEPVACDDPVLGFENVMLTPHIAGGSRTNILGDIEEIAAGIALGLAGKREHSAAR